MAMTADVIDEIIAKAEEWRTAMKPSLDGQKVDVVEVLRGATAIKELVDQQVKAAVFLLRSHAGLTWADIGERLGISRQAAWERFGGEEVGPEKKRRKKPTPA
jgi:DNA-directed RNA polymerase specialized sigma24 family protein